jgi:hypothetical protein
MPAPFAPSALFHIPAAPSGGVQPLQPVTPFQMLEFVLDCDCPELFTFHDESICTVNFGRPSAAVPLPVVFGGVWL